MTDYCIGIKTDFRFKVILNLEFLVTKIGNLTKPRIS